MSRPRSALPHTVHRDIDAVLKDFKTCSRRLRATLDSFSDDLLTLERLYYKCKNQHRMALFFKRVCEIRRYGQRLYGLDISERVDLIRASFVGLEHTSDQKALRGPWSHVPEKPCVSVLTERLSATSTLVRKMRERLENAYRHFTLAMQSGAFIQLIVLFAAISSRMSVLLLELEAALQLGLSTCNRLLAIIHPTGVHTRTTRQQPLPEPESHNDNDLHEDTGQRLSREPVDLPVTVEEPETEMMVILDMQAKPPPQTNPTNASDTTTTPISKKKPRSKKTKRKLDEIDEIFGF